MTIIRPPPSDSLTHELQYASRRYGGREFRNIVNRPRSLEIRFIGVLLLDSPLLLDHRHRHRHRPRSYRD